MAGSLTIDNINGKVISSSPVATESQVIGVGQTWQDVRGLRAINTTFTNSTGKPIMVLLGFDGGSSSLYVNGISTGTNGYFRCAIIPNGASYYTTVQVSQWLELR